MAKFKIEYEIDYSDNGTAIVNEAIEGESREKFRESINFLKSIGAKIIIAKDENGEIVARF